MSASDDVDFILRPKVLYGIGRIKGNFKKQMEKSGNAAIFEPLLQENTRRRWSSSRNRKFTWRFPAMKPEREDGGFAPVSGLRRSSWVILITNPPAMNSDDWCCTAVLPVASLK